MSEFQVRVLEPAEYRRAHTLFNAARHHLPAADEDWPSIEPTYEPGRSWGAFRAGELIGTALSYASDIAVPGGRWVPMAMVSRVAVRADHTRRGVMTALTRAQLASLTEPIATLRATEGLIYGRFGYGVASRGCDVTVDRRRADVHPAAAAGGQVRVLDMVEALSVLPVLYERIKGDRPGTLRRPRSWWDNRRASAAKDAALTVAIHSGPAGDEGFVTYQVRHSSLSAHRCVLTVRDLCAGSDEAWVRLWRFLLGVDLVDDINAWLRPVDEPLELLLADPRACRVGAVEDETWLRLIDVPTALNARSYGEGGPVVVEVSDPLFAANSGRYLITTEGVRRTDDRPQLLIPVDVLGALYLGDRSPSAFACAGRLTVCDRAALPAADRLFATPEAPWGGTYF